VFRAQFFGSTMEKDDMRRTEVVDMEPAIFQMLLHYIYTDSLPRCYDGEGGRSVAVMQHLMVAADRYGVDRLRLMCEQDLCGKIDMDTVRIMLALAHQHNCDQLKSACLAFMSSSPQVLGAIMETSGFSEHFMANCRPLPLEGGDSGTKGSCREEEIDKPNRNFKRICTLYS
jgi:speckle-type POZ protein